MVNSIAQAALNLGTAVAAGAAIEPQRPEIQPSSLGQTGRPNWPDRRKVAS